MNFVWLLFFYRWLFMLLFYILMINNFLWILLLLALLFNNLLHLCIFSEIFLIYFFFIMLFNHYITFKHLLPTFGPIKIQKPSIIRTILINSSKCWPSWLITTKTFIFWCVEFECEHSLKIWIYYIVKIDWLVNFKGQLYKSYAFYLVWISFGLWQKFIIRNINKTINKYDYIS